MASTFDEKVRAENARAKLRRLKKTQKKPRGSEDIFIIGLAVIAALVLAGTWKVNAAEEVTSW